MKQPMRDSSSDRKGHLLMGIGIQSDLLNALEDLQQGRIAGEIGAQDQGIDEAADEGLQFRSQRAPPDGYRHPERPAERAGGSPAGEDCRRDRRAGPGY